jgi:hypothetical protein
MDTKELATTQNVTGALEVQEVVNQVALIQKMMSAVMKKDEHYGVIPGCGNKPTLLKSGAEKLAMTFRFAPKYVINTKCYDTGHREYEVIVSLSHILSGNFVGEGVGCCTTLENKYRYRWQSTEKEVPKEYWDLRDKSLLGGDQYVPRKSEGKWIIFERIEHDNPADYYNTCLKMAKKRALVDAILTSTAASDIFTQDIEDLVENGVTPESKAETKEPINQPKTNGQKPPEQKKDTVPGAVNIPFLLASKVGAKIPIYTGILQDYSVREVNTKKGKKDIVDYKCGDSADTENITIMVWGEALSCDINDTLKFVDINVSEYNKEKQFTAFGGAVKVNE